MYNYDIKMLRDKIKETCVLSSNKWQVYNTMPIIHIIILSACSPLWKMARNKMNKFSTNKEAYQFKLHMCHIFTYNKRVIQGEN